MLRKRSRAMTSPTNQTHQALMAETENGCLKSPTDKYIKPISSSFFSSPRFFSGFSVKGFTETEPSMSPTSILDHKPFSPIPNSFPTSRLSPEPCLDQKPHHHHPWDKKLDSPRGVVDVLNDEQKRSKPESRMVLFGSQLKIQIPSLPPSVLSPVESPKSPAEFGIKTKNSQTRPISFGSSNSVIEPPGSPSVFTGCLSASEMELSEDYTCVITHGPNPRTTHIYGDCILENCCGFAGFSMSKKENCGSSQRLSYPSEDFLSFCYNCKKNLGQGKDIYMYRGEKAFCSRECRYQEMVLDEGMEKSE